MSENRRMWLISCRAVRSDVDFWYLFSCVFDVKWYRCTFVSRSQCCIAFHYTYSCLFVGKHLYNEYSWSCLLVDRQLQLRLTQHNWRNDVMMILSFLQLIPICTSWLVYYLVLLICLTDPNYRVTTKAEVLKTHNLWTLTMKTIFLFFQKLPTS